MSIVVKKAIRWPDEPSEGWKLPTGGKPAYWKSSGIWHVYVPLWPVPDGGLIGNLANHKVVEHEDGTITVSPSILIRSDRFGEVHGWLVRGEWREA